MKKKNAKELQDFSPKEQRRAQRDYFAQAVGWDADLFLSIKKSERNAWFVAGTAVVMLGVACGAIYQMLPLKTVEPYVIRVDNSTGIVDVVDTLRQSQSDYGEAIAKFFLAKYVRAREGYSFGRVDESYREVAIMSAPTEYRQFTAYIMPRNPDSPVNKLGEKGTLDVKVKSIAFIKPDVATIRFQKIERNQGTVVRVTDWISTVDFTYDKSPMSARDREVSPLGFKVVGYRVDREVITNSPTVVPDSTTPVSPTPLTQQPAPTPVPQPAAPASEGAQLDQQTAAVQYAEAQADALAQNAPPPSAALAVPAGATVPGIAKE